MAVSLAPSAKANSTMVPMCVYWRSGSCGDRHSPRGSAGRGRPGPLPPAPPRLRAQGPPASDDRAADRAAVRTSLSSRSACCARIHLRG